VTAECPTYPRMWSQQPENRCSQQPGTILAAYVENKRYLAVLAKIVIFCHRIFVK
jgi:hypothetical protein